MAEVVRQAEWKRQSYLASLSPQDRNAAVVRRFEAAMSLAANRFAAFNMVVFGIVVWFFFVAGLQSDGFSHAFFSATLALLSVITRNLTRNGPPAQEARNYNVFLWGRKGRWLDAGFATLVAGLAVLTFQKHVGGFLLGMYLGAAIVIIITLVRWGLLGKEPWNPPHKRGVD